MDLPRPMVILFGAGATRAAFSNLDPPPPVDGDFFEIAAQLRGRGTRRLVKLVAGDVFELYNRTTGIGLEQYYRDIETRLELSTFTRSKNRPKDWKFRTQELEELIRRVLVHTTCELGDSPTTPRQSELHETILSRVRATDTLLTFNYDTVIEESMPPATSLWTPRGGYGIEVTGITHDWTRRWFAEHLIASSTESQITLLKLHGSLNWDLYENSAVRLKERPYLVRAQKGSPVYESTAMLPPGWHKRVNRNPYKTLWQQARRKLEECSTLVMIGYSLPDTDLIARALFLEVIRLRAERGDYIKELHIADLSDPVKKRLVDLFVPALGAHGLVFRYGSAQQLADTWRRPIPA